MERLSQKNENLAKNASQCLSEDKTMLESKEFSFSVDRF